jgi:HEAT repeat protein
MLPLILFWGAGAIAVVPYQTDVQTRAAGLLSADPAVRTRAACELRELGGGAAGAMKELVAMLADGSPVEQTVCGERTWGRGRYNKGTTIEMTSPGEQAASALVAIGSPAYEPLTRALTGPAWIARKNAAWGLGALGHREAAPLLTTSLHDGEPAVRHESAWALGALDASTAVPALIDALKDVDATVREQAAWALGAIGDHRAVAALGALLKDAEAKPRQQAAWALGAIGDRAAVDSLIAALNDSVATVREQSAWALGAIGDRRASEALTKLLKDSDARVRRQAAWALGAIGG